MKSSNIFFAIICCCYCRSTIALESQDSISEKTTRNTEPQFGADVSQYVAFLVIIAAAGLQIKSQMLWSESRMLRKVRSYHPQELRNYALPILMSNPQNPHQNEIFTELYVKLSKGRHRPYGRLYPMCYYYFTYIVDMLGFSSSKFETLATSDSLIAFRLLIYLGSLTVLGAKRLSAKETILLISMVTMIASSILLSGIGVIIVPESAVSKITAVWWVLFSISIASDSVYFVFVIKGYSTTISDIAYAIWNEKQKRLKIGGLADTEVSSYLHPKQKKRLDMMSNRALESLELQKIEAPKASRSCFPTIAMMKDFDYWILIRNIILFSGESLLGSWLWGRQSSTALPAIVFLECLQYVGGFMLFINDTKVEPELFKELMKIAELPPTNTATHSMHREEDMGQKLQSV